MASWGELEASEPEFAAAVRARFESGRHKTLATLRRDGSPRLSGIELEFGEELTFGVMPASVKERDLLRDPRLAVHSPSPDPPVENPSDWVGDAKIAGRAVEFQPAQPQEPAGRRFRVELSEVVLTRVGTPADHLVIESWHPGRGRQRRERK
jgi:Pyridoxamine 5'-phosphate oxidase